METANSAQIGVFGRLRLFMKGAAWPAACFAAAAVMAAMLALHTSGRLIRPELLAWYLILLPPLAAIALRRPAGEAAGGMVQAGKVLPLLALCAGLPLLLSSSLTGHKWFYFLDWTRPWFAGFSGPALLALLAAGMIPFFAGGAGKPASAALWLMAAAQAACFIALLCATAGGGPLYSDDHPSFIFRHWEFARTFPQLLNYNPYWNGGTTAIVGTTSGTASLGILFWPFWRWLPVEKAYTWLVGAAFIVIMPLAAAAAARIAGGGKTAAGAAGLLALGVSRHFFLWAMHYGTVGACFSSFFVLPFAACVFRAAFLGRRDWKLGAALVASAFFLVAWPPGALMALCVMLPAVLHGRFWRRQNLVFFAFCCAAALLLSGKFLLAVFARGGDVMSHVLAESGGEAAAGAEAYAWAAFLARGGRYLLEQISEGNPALTVFGLLGAFFIPYRGAGRWFAPMLLGLAALTGWGREWKPNLQLGRMAIPLFFLSVLPAALNIERLLGLRDFRLAAARAVAVAALILSGWNAALLYGNRSPAKYVVMPPLAREVAGWIRENVPAGGRVMFAGRVVHALGRGHVAPLPIFTGREMMACDYYHFPVQMTEYDYPPACFKRSVPQFCELYNVTHILTYHDNWKTFFRAMPDEFEELRDFDIFTMFRVKREPTLFLRGGGSVEARFNRFIVLPDEPEREQVLKYNWAEGLQVEPPARIYPVELEGGLKFIGIAPEGQRRVVIKFRSLL